MASVQSSFRQLIAGAVATAAALTTLAPIAAFAQTNYFDATKHPLLNSRAGGTAYSHALIAAIRDAGPQDALSKAEAETGVRAFIGDKLEPALREPADNYRTLSLNDGRYALVQLEVSAYIPALKFVTDSGYLDPKTIKDSKVAEAYRTLTAVPFCAVKGGQVTLLGRAVDGKVERDTRDLSGYKATLSADGKINSPCLPFFKEAHQAAQQATQVLKAYLAGPASPPVIK